ncbi:MAG: sulfur carrier protein ThiS [Marinilabiliaceae bacterium]
MNIYLNSQPVVAGENVSLAELLRSREIADKKGIAVAVNNVVITKKDWPDKILQDNDKITIITAIKGG